MLLNQNSFLHRKPSENQLKSKTRFRKMTPAFVELFFRLVPTKKTPEKSEVSL